MEKLNKMIITESVSLKLLSDACSTSFTNACTRFFKSASMLPPAASLGMRIAFCHDEIPSVTVFSDAALAAEDYAWMFKPCAEIVSEKMKSVHDLTETRTYLIVGGDSTNKEKYSGFSCLTDELCALGAVLNILVPSGSDRAYVSLEPVRELPLRVLIMLSDAFRGAEILKSESEAAGPEKGVPCEVASENIMDLLSVISDKKTMEEGVSTEIDIPMFDEEGCLKLME